MTTDKQQKQLDQLATEIVDHAVSSLSILFGYSTAEAVRTLLIHSARRLPDGEAAEIVAQG